VELTLTAPDGYRLGATTFGAGERAVLILPATGVPQSYYAKFAAYLAERGFSVLTFDYRGIGRSLHGPLRRVNARMRDWALLDAGAAFRSLTHKKIVVVGHSFGGQILGLLPEPERIHAAALVGSPSGYWRHWSLAGRLWVWPVTHVLLPTLPRLLGYLPMGAAGFGEDLPAGVAMEWATWCRHPRYVVGALGADASYARVRMPLRSYAITDDAFAPLPAVRGLLALYPNAKTQLCALRPETLKEKSIGHFGFFRERFRDSLWRETAEWLERQ